MESASKHEILQAASMQQSHWIYIKVRIWEMRKRCVRSNKASCAPEKDRQREIMDRESEKYEKDMLNIPISGNDEVGSLWWGPVAGAVIPAVWLRYFVGINDLQNRLVREEPNMTASWVTGQWAASFCPERIKDLPRKATYELRGGFSSVNWTALDLRRNDVTISRERSDRCRSRAMPRAFLMVWPVQNVLAWPGTVWYRRCVSEAILHPTRGSKKNGKYTGTEE